MSSKTKGNESMGSQATSTTTAGTQDALARNSAREEEIKLRAYEIYLNAANNRGRELDALAPSGTRTRRRGALRARRRARKAIRRRPRKSTEQGFGSIRRPSLDSTRETTLYNRYVPDFPCVLSNRGGELAVTVVGFLTNERAAF